MELPCTLWIMERRLDSHQAGPLKWAEIPKEIPDFTGSLSWL